MTYAFVSIDEWVVTDKKEAQRSSFIDQRRV